MKITLLRAVLTVALSVTPAIVTRAGFAQSSETIMIEIRNGDQNGKLLISESDVAFESLSDGKRSRTWKYTDVREVSKRGRRELRIRPFRGDRYDFQFKDRGQRDKIYNEVAQRVVVARRGQRR